MLLAPKSNRPWGGGSGMGRQDTTDTEVELIPETAAWKNQYGSYVPDYSIAILSRVLP